MTILFKISHAKIFARYTFKNFWLYDDLREDFSQLTYGDEQVAKNGGQHEQSREDAKRDDSRGRSLPGSVLH